MMSSQSSRLDIQVRNSLTDPGVDNTAPIHYFKKGSTNFYKVWIFLEGRDLPYVDYVVYHLHESFNEPVRKIPRSASNPNCMLVTWTWGTFELVVEVVDKKGNSFTLNKDLDWDQGLTTDRKYVLEKTIS